MCTLNIPENTFLDAEDGSTSNLRLTVYPIDEHNNFLIAVPYSAQIEGVGLSIGIFKFRIEARDRKNQVIFF